MKRNQAKGGLRLAKFLESIRSRCSPAFLFVTACFTVVTVLIWYFALFDGPRVRTIMSIGIFWTLVYFEPPPRTWSPSGVFLWLLVAIVLVMLFGIGDKFNWTAVSMNSAALLITLLYGRLVWEVISRQLVRRNEKELARMVLAGLLLALVASMLFWTAALVKHEESLNLLLLPLFSILFCGIFWAPVACWVLCIADQWKERRVGGPGIRALAMAILFFPVIVVAVIVPDGVGLSSNWSAVSLTFLGVLLSAVISEPLRVFLLEWGKLMPNGESSQSRRAEISDKRQCPCTGP